MTIDDKLPVMDNSWPVNARQSVLGDWWVPLVEKAFAKMNVNYANLDGGMQYEAIRALTGMPVEVLRTADLDEEKVWDKLKAKEQNLVTASCLKDYNGLIGGHAYTVLGTLELNGTRLVQLRSAVGTEKYIGPYGNSDPQWTPETKKLMQ